VNLELAGRAVVVTGGSRGIGRAIAETFALEGCDIAICARESFALEQTAGLLRGHGTKVFTGVCDVAQAGDLERFLNDAHAAFGRIDVLVNNASGFGLGSDDSSWQRNFEVDLLGAVRASRIVTPWLAQRAQGSIVHVASTAALEGPGPAAYSALKAALLSHAKNLALELAPRGIRVNCVAPGAIEFPGGVWDRVKQTSPASYEAMRATIPFGRLGTPEEVARAVVFLASPVASWITGSVLTVDGGQHKGNH